MTNRHSIRRLLAWICSAETMARVVDPTLADIAWERGRPAWLGYAALAKALLVHAVLSAPVMVSRAWSDDGRAIPKAAGLAIAGSVLAAVPLIALPFLQVQRAHASLPLLAFLLAPQALVLTLPAALLLAIPLALRHQEPSARLARRTLALSICFAAATFVLVAWGVPAANQSFRVLASGDRSMPRGLNETGFARLREQIEVLNLTPGGRIAARRIEYAYQVRLALACAPVPLGLVALALAASPLGRRRPWLTGAPSSSRGRRFCSSRSSGRFC
jgi:hypothetical protein